MPALAGFSMLLSLTLANPSQTPSSAPADQRPATGFLYKTLTLDGQTCPYAVYVPPDYAPDRPWPVILFLHGSGERGNDGFLQTEVGIGTAIRRNHRLVPAIVVLPQCRPNEDWTGPMAQMALRCVEQTSREYRLDGDRVYLTGLSLGGQGVWHIAASLPDRFAAIVPICGFAEYGPDTGVADRIAARLAHVPVWCFHGETDDRVPVAKAREMIAALRKTGGEPRYTEYKGADHSIWDRTYSDPELWKWLLAQRRGAHPTTASQPASR